MKKFLAIVLALALCVTLFACGGNKDKNDPTAAPATDAPVSSEAPANPTEAPTPTEPQETFLDELMKGYSLDMSEAEMQAAEGWDVIQIKDIPDSFVVSDDLEIGRGNRIPLWLFGFLY